MVSLRFDGHPQKHRTFVINAESVSRAVWCMTDELREIMYYNWYVSEASPKHGKLAGPRKSMFDDYILLELSELCDDNSAKGRYIISMHHPDFDYVVKKVLENSSLVV